MQKNLVFVSLLLVCLVFGVFSGYFIYTHFQHKSASHSPGIAQSAPKQPQKFILEDVGDDLIPASILDAHIQSASKNPQSGVTHHISPQLRAVKKSTKPKLAIIMDDMAYPWQLKSLHKLGLKITPSFFPSNEDSKFTPKMAAEEKFYMVHLPLEALHFYQTPHRWIKTGESKEEIEDYIASIKRDFPRLAFINNHTGSKFSASYEDMKNLIEVLEKYGITFVDSRTTAATKAPEIYAQMHKPLLSRQMFLDNNPNVKDILTQIKKAIVMAKKKGYVIAICHPHEQTFEALKIAKNTLFKEVELVYVRDIFDLVKQTNAK